MEQPKMLAETPKSTRLDGYKGWIISSFLLFIFLGAPIWWVTVAVYRAKMPFEAIQKQAAAGVDFDLPLDFVLDFAPEFQKIANASLFQREFSTATQAIYAEMRQNAVLKFNYKPTVSLKSASEKTKIGAYTIVLRPAKESLVEIKPDRTILISLPSATTSDFAVGLIARLYDLYFSRESFLMTEVVSAHDSNERKNVFKYSSDYQLQFHLMNGNTENQLVSWDIREALQSYISPFLGKLGPFANFSIVTQIQEYSGLQVKPKQENGRFVVYPQSLPQLINTAEWNLATTSIVPEMHFITYLPHKSFSPLHIIQSDGTENDLNAILAPRFGGLQVLNLKGQASKTHLKKSDLKPVFETFVAQLRELLGIKSLWQSSSKLATLSKNYNVKVVETPSKLGVSDWEVDSLLRIRAIETFHNAFDTLSALARMLENMRNMMVNDHISQMTEDSLGFLRTAKAISAQNLDSHEALLKIFTSCRNAAKLAEKAFFDPSMTSLLYFPDEHLLAVYLPFFFPVFVPYFASVYRLLKQK